MAGAFGTPEQQRLLARCEALHDVIMSTPGMCQSSRFLATDDPERLGWSTIFDHLERDGLFGFRLMPVEIAPEIERRLADRGYRWDTWRIFAADRETALPAARSVVAGGPPEGIGDVEIGTDPDGAAVVAMQQCMVDAGVSPFSGAMLVGDYQPSASVALARADGTMVATAHACRPYNRFSRHAGTAWVGLVAVAASERGRRLGAYVNARAVVEAFERLGADRVQEFVRAGNEPSQRMVEASGLRHDPTVISGVATRAAGRFSA